MNNQYNHKVMTKGPLHPITFEILKWMGREGSFDVVPPTTEIGMAEPTCKHGHQREANQSETANWTDTGQT